VLTDRKVTAVVIADTTPRRAVLRALLEAAGVHVVAEGPALPAVDDALEEAQLVAAYDEILRAPIAWRSLPPLLVVTEDAFTTKDRLDRSGVKRWGIVAPDVSPGQLQAATAAVLRGFLVVPAHESPPGRGRETPDGARRALLADERDQPEDAVEALTRREREVLDSLAEGHSNRAIAARLGISEHTVKFHVSTIYGKLGVASRAEAVRVGVRRGLIAV
jgi:DNA-binding NarL/FixJ family response regulator